MGHYVAIIMSHNGIYACIHVLIKKTMLLQDIDS